MASWHENRYRNSMNNVNFNDPQEVPLDGFHDQSERTQFYRPDHHLNPQRKAQNSFANGCIYILSTMPTGQMPAAVGPSNLPVDGTTFFTKTGMEPRSRSREDGKETMDRKQKRIIKNRESAAQSRARKLAYKSLLENKVVCLEEELKRLKQQKEKEEAASLLKHASNGVPIRRANSGPY